MTRIRRIPAATAREKARSAARFLAADPRVKLVFLFGSASDPDAETVRDIDLGVVTEPRLDLAERLALLADLELAVSGPFDLVPLDGSSIVLEKQVADAGRCLFAREPELETDFVVRARSRYLDFKPFLEVQWRLIGERQEARARGSAG